MPLYDYECHGCGLAFEAQRPIAERSTSCPDCLEPCAPLITFRGAFGGLTTPGSATRAWSSGGLWGAVRSGESPALATTRAMLEAGQYRDADCRTRQSALTFSRTYEMARKNGMDAEARSIEGRMSRLVEERGRQIAGAPERVGRGGKVTRTVTTERERSKRGWEVTRRVRYE